MKNTASKTAADEISRIADRDRKLLLAMLDDLQADIRNLRAENWRHIVEKAERDAPEWSTLGRAASMENCTYDRALRWADRAIAAERTNEARVDGNGKKWVNRKALRAYLRG